MADWKRFAGARRLLVVMVLGGLLALSVAAMAEDKPIVGKPIIKKDPPKPKKDGEGSPQARWGTNGRAAF